MELNILKEYISLVDKENLLKSRRKYQNNKLNTKRLIVEMLKQISAYTHLRLNASYTN